ncbi:hypothetical protein HZA26_03575 [Candidatus Nomurabacteria bacterium]|nr:hypothetical protein [Candidatus Nomurabacteria bacterium]
MPLQIVVADSREKIFIMVVEEVTVKEFQTSFPHVEVVEFLRLEGPMADALHSLCLVEGIKAGGTITEQLEAILEAVLQAGIKTGRKGKREKKKK